ncbi:MAG: pantoate--beta-alanine ligase [Anaerolineales bacterium]|nr:pantoate--beta-alanine ligase [Chloroflexota bacterium]MBL7163389.1 pantoate--beta-alanine ligase [Anaerolineales bacterium]
MKTVISIPELRAARAELPGPVGIVPTMGYLHEGHLSLARRAREECASVVTTIFVNPTQFAPEEDLDAYPRDLERDLGLLDEVGVDLVWMPTPEVIYPENFQTWVVVEDLTQVLEGASRPTHFRGVTTVVAKLFNVVQPQKAYFGQKDAQQAVVIQRMVKDLNFPVEIVVCSIVREPDGLAMSSRNAYLDPAQRQAATVLSRSLNAAKDAFQAGERGADQLRAIVMDIVNAEPLVALEYISCAHPETLLELDGSIERALLSMAVRVGKTRLIDNLVVGG